MESNLTIFSNNQFGDIRVATVNNEPMFCASDICYVLGYSNTSKAIKDHVDEDDRYNETLERGGKLLMINESGIYSLILRSNKTEAKQFKKWITSEVIPSIRKKGGYMMTIQDETPEQTMARAFLIATDTIERQKLQIAELERTKACISDRKTATAMAKAAVLTRENNKLKEENRVLRNDKEYFCAKDVKDKFGITISRKKTGEFTYDNLKAVSKILNKEVKKAKTEYEKFETSFYHKDVFKAIGLEF